MSKDTQSELLNYFIEINELEEKLKQINNEKRFLETEIRDKTYDLGRYMDSQYERPTIDDLKQEFGAYIIGEELKRRSKELSETIAILDLQDKLK